MKVDLASLITIFSITLEITRALPLQLDDHGRIASISNNLHSSKRSLVDNDQNINLQRRGVMNKLKNVGNAAADIFRTKSQKQANALKTVLDPHKHVTPKTLSRLDTINLAKVGPEYANHMKVSDAVKVGKTLNERVNKHADIRDKAMKNINSPEYKIAHYTGKSKEEKEALIQSQFGHQQKTFSQRPETKKLLHNQVHGAQNKIDEMMPLYNTVTHRVASGDAARFDKAHPDNSKKKIIQKGWDHVVNTGTRVNELQTERMLHHQKHAHDTMREKIRTDRHLNLDHPPSTFDHHPNRETIAVGSNHQSSSSNGRHSNNGSGGSSHQSHASDKSSPAVEHIKQRQYFREPDKPKTFSFEAKESRYTKKGKPAPQYFLGDHYINQVDSVKNHQSPLAKQTYMHEYVQPKEVYSSSTHYGSSHSGSQQPHSAINGNGSTASRKPLLGRAPTFSTQHHPSDPGPSHQYKTQHEIHSGSSSGSGSVGSGSGSGSGSNPKSRRVSLADLLKIPQRKR